MAPGGPPFHALDAIARRFPVSVHGVAMSIGGTQRLDPEHLARFAALVERYDPAMVSEHLAWSTHDDIYYNDLLPLPYTDATLRHVCDHVCEVQDAIGRQILIENPSTYVLFQESTWAETDFLRALTRRTGCGLLLDINNVFVSATNHNYAPIEYLQAFPLDAVGEIHLAGHDQQSDDEGEPLLIDSHDRPVASAVWSLYEKVIFQTGPIPTLVEWDDDIPQWPVLKREAQLASDILQRSAKPLGRRHA
jgi:uncharacterized protein (UPF0276 family)